MKYIYALIGASIMLLILGALALLLLSGCAETPQRFNTDSAGSDSGSGPGQDQRLDALGLDLNVDTASTPDAQRPLRIIVIGDSITYHPPKPSIGWTGVWGMAASSEATDYVHMLMASGPYTVRMPYVEKACAGGFVSCLPALNQRPEYAAWAGAGGVLLLQVAEHFYEQTLLLQTDGEVSAWLSGAAAYASVNQMALVCVSRWTISPGPYSVADKIGKSNAALAKHCTKVVDISHLNGDPTTHGDGASPAIQWHPNDTGMAGIAKAVAAALQEL